MLNIYNGTPHAVNIIANAALNPTDRKHYCNGRPEVIMSIPSNGALNATFETVQSDSFADIPVFERKVVAVDALPEGYDVVIVSLPYATAYRELYGTERAACLYTVADVVLDENKRPIGCVGLCAVGKGAQ